MFDLNPQEQRETLHRAATNPSGPHADAFDGFVPGAAQFTMRTLAETARAVSMAGAVVPITLDAINGGTERQDAYFAAHDEIAGDAVDYWTPQPGEVGAAGQITGQLVGGAMQALINPAVLVGSQQLAAAENLTRQGVDGDTAAAVGGVVGAGSAIGIKLPFLGSTLAKRILSGAGGNVAQGAAVDAAVSGMLDAEGYDEQAQQFDPWDARARLLDGLLGAAFGGLAHIEARGPTESRSGSPRDTEPTESTPLRPTDEAALLTSNHARYIDQGAAPGRPRNEVDATAHAGAVKQATEQLLRGERVDVEDVTRGVQFDPDPQRNQEINDAAAVIENIARQEAPAGEPVQVDTPTRPQVETPEAMADRIVKEQPDLMLPTLEADAQGRPVMVRAAEALATVREASQKAQRRAPGMFRVAAECLLRSP